CQICLKTFPREYHLKLHQTIHCMEKPHKCQRCHKTFKTRWLASRHASKTH
ncbi:hypothetical protein HELRODRAFT_148154, partial [Helobdella robusta]|uniref:C2H2-type domain-containing protein n=1 Tax=Helobdella robusta TaxID=6412 RepID=T1EK56_HELRO